LWARGQGSTTRRTTSTTPHTPIAAALLLLVSSACDGVGSSGGPGGSSAGPLGPTTFVFERRLPGSRDHLVAMDFTTLEERVITTLEEGTTLGWNIDGAAVSPDRTRIVIATPYGATIQDTSTGLATNILWSLDTNGGDFRRLTPTFESSNPGAFGWSIDVRDPAFSSDGSLVAFDYGEGNAQTGYVASWTVPALGGTPSLFPTNYSCSVNGDVVFHPVTGDLLIKHDVCADSAEQGFYSYPSSGGAPTFLVNSIGYSISSEPPAFTPDGALFLYTARSYADTIQSLFAYRYEDQAVIPILNGTPDIDIVNAAVSPDNLHIVYCVKAGDAFDLRMLDFSSDVVTDVALTADGVSCDPMF
jgi:hypothetical protein